MPAKISMRPQKNDKVNERIGEAPAYCKDIIALTAVGPTVVSLMVPRIA